MPNDYYERQSQMDPGGLADGLAMEQEFDAISRAFGKLPKPHRNGGGFEGPTKVGDPVNEGDAVNLGSLEKLNLPIYRKKITTENWGDIKTPGIYDVVGASGNDKPPAHNYGVLQVYSFNGVVNQIYYPDVSDTCVLAKRMCPNISQGVWQPWYLLSPSSIKSTCLVNATGTGAPHETVVPQLPANIALNTRYVLPNPFGNNIPVICWAEIFVNNKWADICFTYDSATPGSYGTKATFVHGEGIIVQTGSARLGTHSNHAGGGHGVAALTSSAPCRVFVRKLEA